MNKNKYDCENLSKLKPLVSVIMPVYNSEDTLCESIESVLKQSYDNWELIITDDNSTDSSCQILKDYSTKDSRIKIHFFNQNLGAGVARNNSIKHAMGRFIAFLDSDDFWPDNKLHEQINFMLQNKIALCYTPYKKINIYGEVTGSVNPPQKVNYKQLLKSNVIGCLTAIYDTHGIGKIYMPEIRKRQDMGLWLNILQKIDSAYCLNTTYAFYREREKSLSSNKISILKWQWSFYHDYLKFGILRSSYYFCCYAYYAVIKHYFRKVI